MGKKPFLRALGGEAIDPAPFWFMRQAGRHLPEYRALRADAGSFLDLCYTPEFAHEATMQPIRRYGMSAAILFSDILVVPHAMGVDLRFEKGEGPILETTRERARIEALSADRLHEHLSPVYETVRRVRASLDDDTALIGFAGAPWTLAAYMIEGRGSRDFAIARSFARKRREDFALIIEKLTEAVADYLIAQIDAGAEAVQLFDSWAGALAPEERVRWCEAPIRAIVERLRVARPETPIIGFPRMIGGAYVDFAERTGVDGLSLDATVDVAWAARAIGGRCLQGNLDPMALLEGGTAMVEEADAIRRAYGERAFVFNLGHGVTPETDPGEVERLVERLKSPRGSVM